MKPSRYFLAATLAAVGLLLLLAVAPELQPALAADDAAAVPESPAEHAAQAQAYENEAIELEAKAARHEALAQGYAERVPLWGKKRPSLRTLAQHCAELAESYRAAARSARAMAAAHREAMEAPGG